MSAVKYVARTLYVKWRELLTMRLHSSYFRNSAYYKLNVLQDRLDNMWVWLCKCKGNLIRWFYHSGTSHQGLGRQNRQMGPWPLTFKSRGPFRKSMGHWSHGVGRMIGNKEMIGTIRGSSTVFFCWCQIMFCIPRSWHFFFCDIWGKSYRTWHLFRTLAMAIKLATSVGTSCFRLYLQLQALKVWK